jgi:hypothetical protein
MELDQVALRYVCSYFHKMRQGRVPPRP